MSQQCFSSRSGAVMTRRVVLVESSAQLIFFSALRFCIHANSECNCNSVYTVCLAAVMSADD